MFDKIAAAIQGHVRIRDTHTGEVLVDKANAVHYGNMSWAVAQALSGNTQGSVSYMLFGSGGSSVDASGRILYRQPNTSNVQDPNALPYNPTFFRELDPPGAPTGNNIQVLSGFETFADMVTTVTLTFGEPVDQNSSDDETPVVSDFVFDELALYTAPVNLTDDVFTDFTAAVTPPDTRVGRFQDELDTGGGRMLTHVIFHPVQKAANRELEIEYTLRVAMGP